MMVWIESALLLSLLAVAVYLVVDLFRQQRSQRQQAEALERLQPDTEPDRPFEREPERPGAVERRLRAAGVAWGTTTYYSAMIVVAILAFLLFLELLPGQLLAAALASLVILWISWSLLGSWARHRATAFEEKLADAVGYMTSALEVGENPTGALASAANSAEGAVSRELAQVVTRLEAGTAIRPAMWPMAASYDSEGLRLFSQTLIAKWTAGGDMAPILRSITRIIHDRLAMRLRLRSELAGARLSAVLVAMMPYALIPVLLWRRPEWIGSLIRHPLGLQLLVAAVLLQLVGFIWLWRIMRIEK